MNVFSTLVWRTGVGLVVVGWASMAWAAGTDDVMAAVDKLNSVKSYSWVAKLGDAPEVRAKKETDGFTSFVATFLGKPVKIVAQSYKRAVLTDAGWKASDDLNADDFQQHLQLHLSELVTDPVMEIPATMHDVPTMQAKDGQYTGALTDAGVVNTIGEYHEGTTVQGHGTFTVTIVNGMITQSVLHAAGTVTDKTGTKPFDRTDTFSISDVDSTTPDVPDGAKQVLSK